MRPVVTAAGAGGLSTLLLSVLRDINFGDNNKLWGPYNSGTELCSLLPPVSWSLDWPSLAIGIFIGILLGPILDLLIILRITWVRWARSYLAPLPVARRPLSRVLE